MVPNGFDYEQRLLSMTREQWAALEALAERMNSIATRGPQAQQSSWRQLMEDIADGKVVVITPLHRTKLNRQRELA